MTAHLARSAHPEWGYLAPVPGFVRMARVALVACAVGATAGAGVVVSLLDRLPERSVAARTLVREIETPRPTPGRSLAVAFTPGEPALAVPALTPANAADGRAKLALAGAGAETVATGQSEGASAGQAPKVAAAEASAVSGDTVPHAAETTTAGKKAKTKHYVSRNRWRGWPPGIPTDDDAVGRASRWAAGDTGPAGYHGPRQAWGGIR